MKIVGLNANFFALNLQDTELLIKHGRPCVLVLKLNFRGSNYDFAVPFRSNISPNAPKSQYFALPPRFNTKPNHRHGIHYLKMFPIKREYLEKFNTSGNKYYETIVDIINRNTKVIVTACQNYLRDYEVNDKPNFATDLDYLIDSIIQSVM